MLLIKTEKTRRFSGGSRGVFSMESRRGLAAEPPVENALEGAGRSIQSDIRFMLRTVLQENLRVLKARIFSGRHERRRFRSSAWFRALPRVPESADATRKR